MNDEDRAWADYTQDFRSRVLPQLLSSACFLSIGPRDDDLDVRQAAEIGAALLLGKPFLLVVPRGREVPAGLRRAADLAVDDFDPADSKSLDRLAAALQHLVLRRNAIEEQEARDDG